MVQLKFDRLRYEAVMLNQKKTHAYAYDKEKHPEWKEAADDTLYVCHPISEDGDLFYEVHIVLRKEELKLQSSVVSDQ